MNTYLYHHGILGQKWGIRRFQNPDGTLTEAGKQRARKDSDKLNRLQQKTEKSQAKQLKRAEQFNRRNQKAVGLVDFSISRRKSSVKRAADKLRRANDRFARDFKKANKFYKKMEKRYGNNLYTEFDPALIARGQAYASSVMTNALNAMTIQQLVNSINYSEND